MVQRPQAGDLIMLKNQGVSDRVINALQQAPPPRGEVQPVTYAQPTYVQPVYAPPPAVIVEQYWGPAYCPPPRYHYHPRRHYCPPPRGVSWGVEFNHR
jgi:hypothetical protein